MCHPKPTTSKFRLWLVELGSECAGTEINIGCFCGQAKPGQVNGLAFVYEQDGSQTSSRARTRTTPPFLIRHTNKSTIYNPFHPFTLSHDDLLSFLWTTSLFRITLPKPQFYTGRSLRVKL